MTTTHERALQRFYEDATNNKDPGLSLFFSHLLNPHTSSSSRFCAHYATLTEYTPRQLLDFAVGLYVLGHSLPTQLSAHVNAGLRLYNWTRVFHLDQLSSDEFLCDAIVWLCVFERAGLDALHDSKEAIQQRLEARRLQGYPPLQDSHAWKWQARLATCILYTRSAWGLEPLAEPFEEEFSFLLDNLPRAIAEYEFGLVGEFIYCIGLSPQPLYRDHGVKLANAKEWLAENYVEDSSLPLHVLWGIVVGLHEMSE